MCRLSHEQGGWLGGRKEDTSSKLLSATAKWHLQALAGVEAEQLTACNTQSVRANDSCRQRELENAT